MRIYIITPTGVKVHRSLSAVKKELSIEKDDMKKVGRDYVVEMTDESYEIAKDIRLLESVASKKVFSKDKFDTTNWLIVFGILVTYLTR